MNRIISCLIMTLLIASCNSKTVIQITPNTEYEFNHVIVIRDTKYYSQSYEEVGIIKAGTRLPLGIRWGIPFGKNKYLSTMWTVDKNISDNDIFVPQDSLELYQSLNGSDYKYKVEGNTVYRIINNKKYPIKGVEMISDYTKGKIGSHFIFDRTSISKLDNEKLGTYYFDNDGNFIVFIPLGKLEESTGIFISQNEKYFAVDEGTWTVRGLSFYTFPEAEKISSVLYTGQFYWDNDYLYYTAIDRSTIPNFFGDDNNYHKICRYNMESNQSELLYSFSDLTDVFLINKYENTLIIKSIEVESIEDWSSWKNIHSSYIALKIEE